MGLRDKHKNIQNVFRPIDLNEENVNALFNQCVDNFDPEHPSHTVGVVLTGYGYENSTPSVFFNIKKIKPLRERILYLFGQLSNMHSKDPRITPRSIEQKYDGSQWTENGRYEIKIATFGTCRWSNDTIF